LWALLQANRDSLVIRARAFDERFGSTAAREAIMSGADPDVVMQRQQAAVQTFLDRARRLSDLPVSKVYRKSSPETNAMWSAQRITFVWSSSGLFRVA